MRKIGMFFCAIIIIMTRTVTDSKFTFAGLVHNSTVCCDADNWYDDDNNLVYPYTMNDPLWKDLDEDERYAVCQIPETILEYLSTEQLLEMVKKYPNYTAMYRYSDKQEAFQNLYDNFNGLRELMSRNDCKDVTMTSYSNFIISEETNFDYYKNINLNTEADDMNTLVSDEEAMKVIRADSQLRFSVSIMELILSQNIIQEDLTSEDIEEISAEIMKKNIMKDNSQYYEKGTTSMYSGFVDSKYAGSVRVAPIRTRSGRIPSWHAVSNPTTMSYDESLTWVSSYRGCIIVENGTTEYNCFAYAWLSLDSWNVYYRKRAWLTDDRAFTNDPKYIKVTSYEPGRVISSGTHAGVVKLKVAGLRPDGSVFNEPLIVSKWADGPLVEHPLSSGGWFNYSIKIYK